VFQAPLVDLLRRPKGGGRLGDGGRGGSGGGGKSRDGGGGRLRIPNRLGRDVETGQNLRHRGVQRRERVQGRLQVEFELVPPVVAVRALAPCAPERRGGAAGHVPRAPGT
jgi:hypothetical protein